MSARIAYVDYQPIPRRKDHVIEPGMIARPRAPDGTRLDERRWTVERVGGAESAFTRCKTGGGAHPVSQYWATDSLRPVKFKEGVTTVADTLRGGQVEKAVRKTRDPSLGPDELAIALKACTGLDALIAYAESRGYPDGDTLRSKVSHLNPGLQRMNVGNRLRTWLEKNAEKPGGG